MTKKERFFKFHEDFTKQMLETTKLKNNDYTGASDCPFANFTSVEVLGAVTTEQGFLTRMMDKMQRISTFTKTGSLLVKDENVTDALMDLANYAVIFAAYLEEKKNETT